MEEINLDLESTSHKSIDLNTESVNSENTINIISDDNKKDSNIGIDLLMNKSKTGMTEKPSNEFKPSDSVSNDSIEKTDISLNLNDIGSSSAPSLETSTSLSDSNNITNITLESEKPSDDLKLNLDDLFNEDNKTENNLTNETVDSNVNLTPEAPKKSYEDLQKEKAEYLRLLDRLQQKGIHAHKKFNMNSEYSEVKEEFERLSRQRECDQSIKFQRKMLIAMVTGIEFLNTKFDPFDIKLEGWSESVHENVNDYDDVFEELHEKYKSKAKMAPELKLLFMLAGSGFMFHLTNTMFKSSLPGMGDIMKQNPDLMRQFAQAATSSMSKNEPGFANLMGDVLGGGGQQQPKQAPPRKEMQGPPNINDMLNNMNSGNKLDIDMNSNFSESDIEQTRTRNKTTRTLNLDV